MDLSQSFVYTVGMTAEEVSASLQTRHTGVLSLAADNRPYSVPVSYVVDDGGNVFLRLSDDATSEKVAFLEVSDGVSFLVYDEGEASGAHSWSVVIQGTLREVDESVVPQFAAFHVFDEDIDSLSLRYFHLVETERTGRRACK